MKINIDSQNASDLGRFTVEKRVLVKERALTQRGIKLTQWKEAADYEIPGA